VLTRTPTRPRSGKRSKAVWAIIAIGLLILGLQALSAPSNRSAPHSGATPTTTQTAEVIELGGNWNSVDGDVKITITTNGHAIPLPETFPGNLYDWNQPHVVAPGDEVVLNIRPVNPQDKHYTMYCKIFGPNGIPVDEQPGIHDDHINDGVTCYYPLRPKP